ncbi:MAG: Maf family protein [Sandaracinaceae bacterium]|nr:Maf family protein [Sandaracinaceae bacterium]
MSLVLASASPRRREILATLGVAFEVVPGGAAEEEREGERPEALARRLARDKALEVSRRVGDRFVLGADTVVVVEGRVLGKPADDDHARAMLRALSNRWHEVITGVALARGGAVLEDLAVTTRVHVAPLSAERIERYVATGEGRDKAGGYAVQGVASGFCDRLEGSYGNVVGLPAAETVALLERHGVIAGWP